jgi:proteasome accessory factor PafA2
MDIQFGLETEIGITRERAEGIDVVAESIALVRSAMVPGVRSCWDYGREDPHRDARGFRVAQLRQDTDEANYFAQDASRPLSFAEIKSDLVLRNGARFYNDHAHPEYCTPECSTLRELIRQDATGDRLLMECAAAVSAGSDNPVRLYKNNTDFLGHSYGCHENYLLPRSLGWAALAGGIQAFLVTRQIYAGAGKYGWEDEDRFLQPGFQLAQRSDFFTELQSVDTMQRRPIVNTRDEPHADPARFRRFHVIIGDANLSPFATYLKVGATALVLRALTAGAPTQRIPRLSDPLAALRSVSRDPARKWEVRTAAGRNTTAIAVQRAYRELAREFAPPRDREDEALFEDWGMILDDLERDPDSTSDRLDWAAKHRLIEGFRESESIGADDPWLRSLDLAYHELDREQGLFYGLWEKGSFRPPFPDEPEAGNEIRPPETTRAALRGGCIEKFGPLVESAQWDGVILKGEGGGRIELDLRAVFDRTQVEAGRIALAAARAPEDLLCLPFAKRI